LRRPILEIQDGNIAVGDSLRRIFSLKVNDSIRVRIGQRAKQDAVNEAENGGVGADADCEGQHRDGSEGWLFRQHS
jgi:hypothetical protein